MTLEVNETHFGLRQFTFKENQLYLNGEPLFCEASIGTKNTHLLVMHYPTQRSTERRLQN